MIDMWYVHVLSAIQIMPSPKSKQLSHTSQMNSTNDPVLTQQDMPPWKQSLRLHKLVPYLVKQPNSGTSRFRFPSTGNRI